MCVFTSEQVVQQQSQKTASLSYFPGQAVPFEVGALIIPITIVIMLIILIATIEDNIIS